MERRDPGRIGGSEKEERDVRVRIAAPGVSAGCAALYGGIDDAQPPTCADSPARLRLASLKPCSSWRLIAA